MNIKMKHIQHKDQCYPTVGDWKFEGEDLNISVSDMGNWKYEFLVSMHEMIEAILCKDRNIDEESVTLFDKTFEQDRHDLNWPDDIEPGNDKNAPYRQEHQFAEIIERLLAKELNVDWEEYSKTVAEL